MSIASKFEKIWHSRGGVIPKSYMELKSIIQAIDYEFDVRVKDDPPMLMITFSDGSCVKLEATGDVPTQH